MIKLPIAILVHVSETMGVNNSAHTHLHVIGKDGVGHAIDEQEEVVHIHLGLETKVVK